MYWCTMSNYREVVVVVVALVVEAVAVVEVVVAGVCTEARVQVQVPDLKATDQVVFTATPPTSPF